MDITQDTLDSLVGKLRSLDLTDEEAVALEALMLAAASAGSEVEGFAQQSNPMINWSATVKCDVHPYMKELGGFPLKLGDPSKPRSVVINHEEQYLG